MLWRQLPEDLGAPTLRLTLNRPKLLPAMLLAAACDLWAIAFWQISLHHGMKPEGIWFGLFMTVLIVSVTNHRAVLVLSANRLPDFSLCVLPGKTLRFPVKRAFGWRMQDWPLRETALRALGGALEIRRANRARVVLLPSMLPEGWASWALRAGLRKRNPPDLLVMDAFAAAPFPVERVVHALVLTQQGTRRVAGVATTAEELTTLYAHSERIEEVSWDRVLGTMATKDWQRKGTQERTS
jgi:hypothetical protein